MALLLMALRGRGIGSRSLELGLAQKRAYAEQPSYLIFTTWALERHLKGRPKTSGPQLCQIACRTTIALTLCLKKFEPVCALLQPLKYRLPLLSNFLSGTEWVTQPSSLGAAGALKHSTAMEVGDPLFALIPP